MAAAKSSCGAPLRAITSWPWRPGANQAIFVGSWFSDKKSRRSGGRRLADSFSPSGSRIPWARGSPDIATLWICQPTRADLSARGQFGITRAPASSGATGRDNRRFDSASTKSTSRNGSKPTSCQRHSPAPSIKNVPCRAICSKRVVRPVRLKGFQLGIGHHQEGKPSGTVVGKRSLDPGLVVGADGDHCQAGLRNLPFAFRKRFELLFAMQAAAPEEEDQQDGLSVEFGQRVFVAPRRLSASNPGPPRGATTAGPARGAAAGRPTTFEFPPAAANRSDSRIRGRSAPGEQRGANRDRPFRPGSAGHRTRGAPRPACQLGKGPRPGSPASGRSPDRLRHIRERSARPIRALPPRAGSATGRRGRRRSTCPED